MEAATADVAEASYSAVMRDVETAVMENSTAEAIRMPSHRISLYRMRACSAVSDLPRTGCSSACLRMPVLSFNFSTGI